MKNEFKVTIPAMRLEELLRVITSDETVKLDFREAISLFVRQNPKGFLVELRSLAEDPERSDTVRGRVLFYLIREGYVDSDFPDEALREG